jgi:hypothetical protein
MFVWVEVAEEWLKKLFKGKWFHWALQGIAIALCTWWWFHVPAPGKALLALTIVAVVMTIEGLTGWQRALWLVIVFALAFLENRAIDKDRHDFSDFEASRRAVENQQFSNIGSSITTSVQKLLDHSDEQFKATVAQQSQQFAATMRIEQKNVDQITGGKSYAVIMPDTTDSTADSLPIGITMCAVCEESINAAVYVQKEVTVDGVGDLIYQGQVNPYSMFTIGKLDVIRGKEKLYKITVFARNKPTLELLKIRFNRDSQHWEFSYSINRLEKQPHLNPKTRMAEGEEIKILVKETKWDEFNRTPENPAKTKIH